MFRNICFKNHFLEILASRMVQKSFAGDSCVKNVSKIIFWKFLRQEWFKNHLREILASRMVEKSFAGDSCVKNG